MPILGRIALSRRMQIGLAVAALVVIGVIVALLWPKAAKSVSVATIQRRSISQTAAAPGKVNAVEKTNVGSIMAGRIDEIFVKEGDLVARGDALMALEADDLKIAVQQAQVNLQIARLNQANARQARQIARNNLSKLQSGVPPSQLAVGQATLNQAQAGVEAAQQGLADVARLNTTGLEVAKSGVVQARKAWEAARQAATDAQEQLVIAQETTPALPAVQLAGYEAAAAQAQANLASADAVLDGAKFALANAEAANSQALNAAQAQLVTAQRTRDVAQAQFDAVASTSGLDIDTARHQLNQADNNVRVAVRQVELARLARQNAEVQRRRAVIRSPIVGVVDAINVNEGEVVSPAPPSVPNVPPIAIVIDPDQLLFEADVDEADVVRVRRGEHVEIALDAYPGRTFNGTVRRVGVTIVETEEGGTAYPATIGFARKDIAGLREGMNGEADITVQTVDDVLAVPASAIVEQAGASYVFVVQSDQTVKRVGIRTGRTFDGTVEITSGVSPGDRVVTRGTAGLQDGDRVTWQ